MVRSYTICVILVSVWTGISTADSKITYNCTSDGVDIDFSALADASNFSVALGLSATGVSTTSCAQTLISMPSNNSISVTDCTCRSCKWSLYLQEPPGTLENALNIPTVVSRYSIDCPNPNMTETFNVISGPTPVPLQPTVPLSMTFSNSTIYLGQPVTVTITEAPGSGPHTLKLDSCNASDTTTQETINLVKGGKGIQDDLVQNISSPTAGPITFTLYGFRFVSHPNVTLTCTVKICQAPKNCQSAAVGRRGVITGHLDRVELQTVSGLFRVISQTATERNT